MSEGDCIVSVRDELLELLARSGEGYVSGEELARRLGVSRAAVNKAAASLRAAGAVIEALPNRGYRLAPENDLLCAASVRAAAESPLPELEVFESLGSTNTRLRELAQDGAPEGTAVIAGRQTAGRGRMGRSFYSPGGSGLYVSLLFRPEADASRAVMITSAAAVAVCETLEALGAERPMIKWVNDIFIGGKKVCGILTEAAFDAETGRLSYAVLGAGINLFPPEGGFPAEISSVAGAVFPEYRPGLRARAAGMLADAFLRRCRFSSPEEFLPEYRARQLALGRTVSVVSPNGAEPALALDVDGACRLVVRYPDGREAALSSGEISVKL